RDLWESVYTIDDIVRRLLHFLQIFTIYCPNAFARERPEFDASARAKAEAMIHQFFSDLLVESAQQFAAEKRTELAASEQNSQSILHSALDCISPLGADGRVQGRCSAPRRPFVCPPSTAPAR